MFVQILQNLKSHGIDLFTDTTAILNVLDLWSIMGCPGGTRSVFTRAFRAKRELQCIFLWKKAIVITSKHGTTIFFFALQSFSRKTLRKIRVLFDKFVAVDDKARTMIERSN